MQAKAMYFSVAIFMISSTELHPLMFQVINFIFSHVFDSSVKAQDKREGGGQYNWGNPTGG